MFYSKDLLSRRSPLGAIWMVAHGKKLSKNKLMGISVQEICEEILHPTVPHSLRLQGILIGGVVVVFSKQQVYLLEDMQEMMRRIKDAINLHNAGPSKATLKQGKDKARPEAITLVDDMETELQQALDLNNALAKVAGAQQVNVLPYSQQAPGLTPADLTQMQDDDLFAVPAISQRTGTTHTHTHTHTHSQAFISIGLGPLAAGINRRNQGRRATGSLPQSGVPYDPDNELFAMVDLGDELGFPAPAHPTPLGDVSGQEQQEMLDEQLNDQLVVAEGSRQGSRAGSARRATGDSSSLGGKPGSPRGDAAGSSPALGPAGLPDRDADTWEHREVTSPEEQQAVQDHMAAVAAELRQSYASTDQEVLTTEEEEQQRGGRAAAAGTGQGRGGAGGRKEAVGQKRQRGVVAGRKLSPLTADGPEDILIKSKDFRAWTLDTSGLITARGFRRDAAAPGTQPTQTPITTTTTRGGGGQLPAGGLIDPLLLSADLQAVLARVYTQAGGGAGRGAAVMVGSDVEEEEDQEEGKSKRRTKKPRTQPPAATTPATAGDATGGSHEQLAEVEEAGLHLEMQDVLHELPFGGEVEVERLRAASVTPGGQGVRLSLAGDAGRLLGTGRTAGSSQPSSLATGTTSHNSSLLAAGLMSRGQRASPDGHLSSDLLLPSAGSRPPSAAAGHTTGSDAAGGSGAGGGLLHWGTGALEDLLPSLDQDLPDVLLDLRAGTGSESDRPGRGGGRNSLVASRSSAELGTATASGAASGRGGGAASGGGGGGGGYRLPGTEAYLLETLGEGSAPQVVLPADVYSAQTGQVVKLMHGLLSAQQAAGAPDPAVSFFSLAQQLTRREAVKLFMQVLVTQTGAYTCASQEEAFGDIMIRAGPRLRA